MELHMSKVKASGSVIFGLLFLHATNASANLLSECNVAANQINRSAPQVIDQVTTLLNANCSQEGRAVQLQYRNRLSVPAGAVNQAKLNTIRPQMVTTWCTDPTQRATLNQLNIQYYYSDDSGRYVGKIDISKADCR